MSESIFRSRLELDRTGLSWRELWQGPDLGLITCWESGRRKRQTDFELAEQAERGELPVLVWKGGCDKRLKSGYKFGSLNYLAYWQGLRNEDLSVNRATEIEIEIECRRTGMRVIFTGDTSKFASP